MKKALLRFFLCPILLILSLSVVFCACSSETEHPDPTEQPATLAFLPITREETATLPTQTVTETGEEFGERELLPELLDEFHLENVPGILQYPEFPTGCEAVAAVSALQFLGYDITPAEFIDEHLPFAEPFAIRDGRLYGPDPDSGFIGNPRDAGSFGCFPKGLKKGIESVMQGKNEVIELEGEDFSELCRHLTAGRPVLVWASGHMGETYPDTPWYLPDGTLYRFPYNEHCLVLTGYSETEYTFMDPMRGCERSWPKELVESRYESLGRLALVLVP